MNIVKDVFTRRQNWVGESLVYDQYIEFDIVLNRCMSIGSADVYDRNVINMAIHILKSSYLELYPDDSIGKIEVLPLQHVANQLATAVSECNIIVYSTFVNAAEIIAYNHPDPDTASEWRGIYEMLLRPFNAIIELPSQYKDRINSCKYDPDLKRWSHTLND